MESMYIVYVQDFQFNESHSREVRRNIFFLFLPTFFALFSLDLISNVDSSGYRTKNLKTWNLNGVTKCVYIFDFCGIECYSCFCDSVGARGDFICSYSRLRFVYVLVVIRVYVDLRNDFATIRGY